MVTRLVLVQRLAALVQVMLETEQPTSPRSTEVHRLVLVQRLVVLVKGLGPDKRSPRFPWPRSTEVRLRRNRLPRDRNRPPPGATVPTSPRSTEVLPSRLLHRHRRTHRLRRVTVRSGPLPRLRSRPTTHRKRLPLWRLWIEAQLSLHPAAPTETASLVSTEVRPSPTFPIPRALGTAQVLARRVCRPSLRLTEAQLSLLPAEPTVIADPVSTEVQPNLPRPTTTIQRSRTRRRWRCSAEVGFIAIRSCELCTLNLYGGFRVRTRAHESWSCAAKEDISLCQPRSRLLRAAT